MLMLQVITRIWIDMKFTLFVKTDSKRKDIKEKCCDVLAEFLKREGYFSVEYDPNELDIDSIGKA